MYYVCMYIVYTHIHARIDTPYAWVRAPCARAPVRNTLLTQVFVTKKNIGGVPDNPSGRRCVPIFFYCYPSPLPYNILYVVFHYCLFKACSYHACLRPFHTMPVYGLLRKQSLQL